LPSVLAAFGAAAVLASPSQPGADNAAAASVPAPRVGQGMVLDEARRQVVLFGGGLRSMADWRHAWADDTWTWSGSSWRLMRTPDHPSARGGVAMASYAAGKQVVLFGGQTTVAVGQGHEDRLLNDTWTWDGSTWTKRSPAHSPPARADASMAFDGQRLVLYGGAGQAGLMQDTWAWTGDDWLQLSGGGPARPQAGAQLVRDEAQGRVLAIQSCAPDRGNLQASHHAAFDGAGWTEQTGGGLDAVSARCGGAVAYDRMRRQLIVFGGTYDLPDNALTGPARRVQGDTLVGDGASWKVLATAAAPPARIGATASFDPNSGAVILFGGSSQGGVLLNDTWAWDGSRWRSLV